MKKYILVVLLLAINHLGFAQSKIDKTKAEVESVERQRFEAQVKKDYTALEKILADDLVYVHSNGKSDTKASFITSIKEGKSVYNKIDVEEMVIRLYNNQKSAIINGVINVTQNPVDGKPTYLHLRYTVVYIKNKGKGWQMVTWQSLRLP